jgi:hypothetical protein
MANVSLPRLDLEAHRDSLMLPMPDLLRRLTSKIGKKLTAFVAGVDMRLEMIAFPIKY